MRTHYNDTEDQHHYLIDVKMLIITCIKNTLSGCLEVSLLLTSTEMILMLLAYKCRREFYQNLSKVQIFFHQYITDAFRLLPPSSHPVIAGFANF